MPADKQPEPEKAADETHSVESEESVDSKKSATSNESSDVEHLAKKVSSEVFQEPAILGSTMIADPVQVESPVMGEYVPIDQPILVPTMIDNPYAAIAEPLAVA